MVMAATTDRRGPSLRRKDQFTPLFALERQASVIKDLFAFFGPDPETYLEVYDEMRRRNGKTALVTWSWPVSFVTFVWFFYRKQYIWGAAVILLPVIASLLFGFAGAGGMAIVFACSAKSLYVRTALRRILKADDLGLAGDERVDYLRRAGGVSVVAAVFAGLLLALFYAAMIYSI